MMPLQTRHSPTECSSRLCEHKDELSMALGDRPDVYVQQVDGNSFTLTCTGRLFCAKVPLMRCKGQIAEDPETGGAKIGGQFEPAVGIKVRLWGLAIAPVVFFIFASHRTSSFFHSKMLIIFIACICASLLLYGPLLSIAHNTKERIYRFLETTLDAEDTRMR